MFSVEEYMELSEQPRVLIYGMRGNPHKMEMDKVERPTAQSVRNICRNGMYGVVSFTDEFRITMPYVDDIFKAELYYGEMLVATRMFPPIYMQMGDTLSLRFCLNIFRDDNGVFV